MASVPTPEPRTERVELGDRSTDVRIGAGLLPDLWSSLRERFPAATRCGLAIDEQVAEAQPLPPPPPELDVVVVRLPAGEQAKSRATLADLQDAWLELRRDEPVVVVGGGAALDVGGSRQRPCGAGCPGLPWRHPWWPWPTRRWGARRP